VLGNNVLFHGDVKIATECYVGDNCVIGQPWDDEVIEMIVRPGRRHEIRKRSRTVLEHDVWVLPNSVVCNGAKVKRGAWCDVGTFIGEDTCIGMDTWLHYGAKIYNKVKIGERCNIAGFVCNRSTIGDNVTSFGSLIHRLDIGYGRTRDRATDDDPSPTLGNGVRVGWNSLIIGGISVGDGAHIGAGSIVTRDVPPKKKVPAGSRF